MSYTRQDGKFANTEDIYLPPSTGAALTADVTSAAVEVGDRRVARLLLDVTANAATSLDVTIQCSRDGVTWYTSGTFAQVTTPASERKLFMLDRFVRASYNHTGSGSISVTLTGETV